MKRIVVIGGGPAGLMAAGMAAGRGNDVLLLEKNNRLGKKLSITGKGRCNLTNASDPEELMANTPGNPDFLYSAFYTFGSDRVMSFFEELGVPLKVERGKRVFPVSDKAADVTAALERFLNRRHVKIRLCSEVTEIKVSNRAVQGVLIKSGWEPADAAVVATGGLACPGTGSTGDGYRFARDAGHHVTKLCPSLVPLRTEETWPAELQGLTLKNVAVALPGYKGFGELLFTHFGLSGPLILTASRFKPETLSIDLKPALNEKELDLRLLRDFDRYKNKNFENALEDLLPQKMIPVMVKLSAIEPHKKINGVTKEERRKFVKLLKHLELTIIGDRGFQEAVITQGGVGVDEIDPSTMESKIVRNLYFAGEVIDVDALTGGFNLQIAFSTGYLAGLHA